ncbi:MAG TPA: glycosyltransferase family 87 protein [Verrucomicrobiae bacterium]
MKSRINAICACIAAVVLFFILFDSRGPEATWDIWNVPYMFPHFADARVITHGAESYAAGYDPMIENPADPWGRPLNYPRVWQLLFALGIDSTCTNLLGFTLIVSFFVGICLLLPKVKNRTLFVILLSILSPSTLLCFERGNIDLFIFFLITLAVTSVKRSSMFAALVIGLAFMLKLYPIFAWLFLIGLGREKFLRYSAVLFVVAMLYTLATMEDICLLSITTPRSNFLSYGTNVYWMSILERDANWGAIVKIISHLLLLPFLYFAIQGLRRRDFPAAAADAPLNLDAFRAGSAIYVGTFFLGNNWDYRLSFLILTLPQLVAWTRHPGHIALLSKLTLAAILLSFWHMFIVKLFRQVPDGYLIAFTFDELCNWFAFFTLAYFLAWSAPSWTKDFFSRRSTQ